MVNPDVLLEWSQIQENNMSQSFILNAIVFILIMAVLNIIKDYLILPNYKLTDTQRANINRRWVISTVIGIILLAFMYGCTEEDKDPCLNKGPTNLSVVCTKIYQPVRAPDGTIYSNSCIAEADGWDNGCLTLVNI